MGLSIGSFGIKRCFAGSTDKSLIGFEEPRSIYPEECNVSVIPPVESVVVGLGMASGNSCAGGLRCGRGLCRVLLRFVDDGEMVGDGDAATLSNKALPFIFVFCCCPGL